jgi:hypothetical protein
MPCAALEAGARKRRQAAVAKPSASKLEQERELRALREQNEQLAASLKREQAHRRKLEDVHRRVTGRLEAAMDRIRSLLTS